MRIQEHVKLSTTAAIIVLPWLKKDVWLPLTASVLVDVDHYLWHAVTHRTLSLRAAVRYFGQADPPQLPESRLLHHPMVLGALLVVATRTRSRILWLILAGLLFHVSLDLIHVTQMKSLKERLNKKAQSICPTCGKRYEQLQLHTTHIPSNILDRYHPRHFVVLCPTCHEEAHATRP
jgi:predicted nucleic-acid-binding Zn-ribbon protein